MTAFEATLIGVVGGALWPAFMAGDVGLSKSNQYDFQKVMVRFEQRGKKFRPRPTASDRSNGVAPLNVLGKLLLREARAAISSSSVGRAAGTALFCCRAGPFWWRPTLSAASRASFWRRPCLMHVVTSRHQMLHRQS